MPIPRRLDRSDNAACRGCSGVDCRQSTSGTSKTIRRRIRNHKRFPPFKPSLQLTDSRDSQTRRTDTKGNPYYEFVGVKGFWRYSQETMQALYDAGEIVISSTGKSLSRKRLLKDAKGTPVTDLWDDANRISPTSSERLDYPTQKPEALLKRVIKTSSDEGDLVLDCFCGSGTAAAVA